MGAYVSTGQCQAFHNITLNCSITNATAAIPYRTIGGLEYGQFQSNSDVAGVGIVYAFFSVALLALATSAVYLILQITRYMNFTGIKAHLDQTVAERRRTTSITLADIFDAIILSCSDQQAFTAGAYAITLRYAQGCVISAYHYNIVANMMLITCATHLMSVTVVSQYWKHKFLATLRVVIISLIYIATALLLSNQNAGEALTWPSVVPPVNQTDSLLILAAACFQGNQSALDKTLTETFGRGGKDLAIDTIERSSPDNRIVAGTILSSLFLYWYGLAILAELIRFWRGSRFSFSNRVQGGKWQQFSTLWLNRLFWLYQFAGAVFCTVAIVYSFNYIRDLRNWMDQSPWLQREPDGTNPENDATTFGQLVPLLLILLTIFVVFQLVGDKYSEYRERTKEKDKEDLEALANKSRFSESSTDIPEKKSSITATVTSIPSTPVKKSSWPLESDDREITTTSTFSSTPLTMPVPETGN
ncbi:hypothetical protein G7Y89_g5050 [Cudoniella acicularis]|uniref:Uncharacterized protein n=1 Tax=Cudoniella acicularis TaxID=354080 RepID=A0A8H4RQE9_9HELO|nr:hypothetical protein G7Y89_g5050 [Cudoniella acicularis]